MLELFFAMFYASVNVGAVLCMWFIPMVRSESYHFIVIYLNERERYKGFIVRVILAFSLDNSY